MSFQGSMEQPHGHPASDDGNFLNICNFSSRDLNNKSLTLFCEEFFQDLHLQASHRAD